jgi:hypothetical protein
VPTRPFSSRGIAQREKISHTTALRHAQFARAVNIIAKAVGEDVRTFLASMTKKMGRQKYQQMAEIAEDQPQAAKHVLAQVRAAASMKAANRIVREAYLEVVAKFSPDQE